MPRCRFTSVLLRSRSALLAGVFRQNPQFHAALGSPIAGLIKGTLQPLILDTSRQWMERLHQLVEFFADFKLIGRTRIRMWIRDSGMR